MYKYILYYIHYGCSPKKGEKMKKEININCPKCKARINLREFREYVNAVRRSFWAGRGSKGIGSMVIIILTLVGIIVALSYALGQGNTPQPMTEDTTVIKEIIRAIIQ